MPIVTPPTFDDWARISAVVNVTGGRGSASPMVRS
jgi:hypothetical protein